MSEWSDIPGFPGYVVNVEGKVASDKTGIFLRPSYNQQGVAHVGMYNDGRIQRRSLAVLVAEAFLPHPDKEHFDTPIHLDGDKGNCSAMNLAWRPRWFAIKYHQQFVKAHANWMAMPAILVDKDEHYTHTIDACVKYGLLVNDVVRAVISGGGRVFPQFYTFAPPPFEGRT